MDVTHTTQKNDKKEVTGYAIKIDGVQVGSATKTEKGKFNYAPINGAGAAIADAKTMRDLKAEVAKSANSKFVEAGKAELKKAKEAAKPAKAEKTASPPSGESDQDVELD